jgi:hypothetical protein
MKSPEDTMKDLMEQQLTPCSTPGTALYRAWGNAQAHDRPGCRLAGSGRSPIHPGHRGRPAWLLHPAPKVGRRRCRGGAR